MEEIGLFPLGIVLLPGERIPLHIFEPRYQELIAECLEQEREFGLILTDDDGLRQIGTRAAVVDVLERFDDGRMNIVVEGAERFRVLGLTSGRSFQTGDVEAVVDEAEDADAAEVERATSLLRRLAELTGAELGDLELRTEAPSFELAARVEFEPRLKQGLLELRSERERLRRLSSLLARAARGVEVQRERSEIAATNGRVTPPQRR
jgi:Lon protease-like protein